MIEMAEAPELSQTPAERTGAVLLCAATRWEAAPLARRLKLVSAGTFLFSGRVQETPVLLVKTGMGADNASRALGTILPAEKLSRVLSVGLAGALNAQAKSDSIVADIPDEHSRWKDAARAAAKKTGAALHLGGVVNSDGVASPAQKRALGEETGALAVDMETAAVRRWARGRGVPALALRVILDELDEELPSRVPAGEDAASLVKFAAANAGSLVRLWSLGRRQRRAMGVLSEFLQEFLPCL
ncbi:MAG TPA: hypothetical protein VNH15_06630 [Elusimicrobiota bacterium]|nr:hypothetical protein [Elusimicrobiota bacterium]